MNEPALTPTTAAAAGGGMSLDVFRGVTITSAILVKNPASSNIYPSLASPDTAPFPGFLGSPKNVSWLRALMYVTGLYLVAWGMYRKQWFVEF